MMNVQLVKDDQTVVKTCHPCYLILYNVSKKHNIGTILRCATAFQVKEVCLVGSRQFNAFGSHGADAYVTFRHFETLEECVEVLKKEEGCTIMGIEIDDDAACVTQHPFTGPTAFMIGNEGQGLNEKQMTLCNNLVYIPQHGPGTASLNVAVATSIVLHHFAQWAGYPERERQGHKYDVADRPQRNAPRGMAPRTEAEIEAIREARKRKKESLVQQQEQQ